MMPKSATELLEEFIGEMRPGAASIRHGLDKSGNEYVEVCPQNPGAARIRALLDQSGEYVIAVGIGTVIEIQPELADDGHDQRSGEGRFLDVCRAVAKGSFLEQGVRDSWKNPFCLWIDQSQRPVNAVFFRIAVASFLEDSTLPALLILAVPIFLFYG